VRPSTPIAVLRRRVRPHAAAIVQTAVAASAAWGVALLALPATEPAFASIAAIISLGVTLAKRRRRAVELLGGVVLGITVATALVALIGTGVWQIGALVILAMTAALLLPGGELLVSEAAVSAVLLAAFQSTAAAFSADRILEAIIGGTVALAVASVVLPPDPVVLAGRAAQSLFGRLGTTLEEIAAALSAGDPRRADAALAAARAIDDEVETLEAMLLAGAETARLAPARRGGLELLSRYEHALPQVDFAVRNTRVLARHACRYARGLEPTPAGFGDAVRDLAAAVWALARQYEAPDAPTELRDVAMAAAHKAAGVHEREPAVADLAAQVRLVAVDLVRAAERLGTTQAAVIDAPTEELLAVRGAEPAPSPAEPAFVATVAEVAPGDVAPAPAAA